IATGRRNRNLRGVPALRLRRMRATSRLTIRVVRTADSARGVRHAAGDTRTGRAAVLGAAFEPNRGWTGAYSPSAVIASRWVLFASRSRRRLNDKGSTLK